MTLYITLQNYLMLSGLIHAERSDFIKNSKLHIDESIVYCTHIVPDVYVCRLAEFRHIRS